MRKVLLGRVIASSKLSAEEKRKIAKKKVSDANKKVPKKDMQAYKAKLLKVIDKIKKLKSALNTLEQEKIALRKKYGVKVAKKSPPKGAIIKR